MGNHIKTVFLLTAMTGLFLVLGYALGGQSGMVIALIIALVMNFFSYWQSHTIVLKMYRAQPVDRSQAPGLHDTVARLAQRAGLPMPKLYVIPQEAPNAFATGRDPEHGVVAVTEGLLRLMNQEELEGVLAHELGHIKNRDILISTIVATLAGAIMFVASMARFSAFFGGRDNEEGGLGFVGVMVMSILAPMAAMVVQMAVSRSREYLADATAAQVTGRPQGLASALNKLGEYTRRGAAVNANPSTAHMFIVNPLSGRQFASLFSTHPPLEERIRRLTGAGPSSGAGPRESQGRKPSMTEQSRKFWDSLS
ncbi:zinc metalloprotease HtpX [Desulfotignum balticum]|jgi:heat shock protein HtpX|uniref:zinc metalloprotease HtpX n=1 Tax=Desulfotignum balticum TaxID=115781 RepID=UPI0004043D76|nr:zinc metalloprotease HtpX [Desulfotignum balticum]